MCFSFSPSVWLHYMSISLSIPIFPFASRVLPTDFVIVSVFHTFYVTFSLRSYICDTAHSATSNTKFINKARRCDSLHSRLTSVCSQVWWLSFKNDLFFLRRNSIDSRTHASTSSDVDAPPRHYFRLDACQPFSFLLPCPEHSLSSITELFHILIN
jgi:hypothetical protein